MPKNSQIDPISDEEPIRILGIETSCDETSAAVIRDGRVLGHVILSQDAHERFGGVVPEIAARAHLRQIDTVVNATLEEAGSPRDPAVAEVSLRTESSLTAALSVMNRKPFEIMIKSGRPVDLADARGHQPIALFQARQHLEALFVGLGTPAPHLLVTDPHL